MDSIDETLALLVEGERFVKFKDEVILVIGNSGSGKSTFVQYLAGDNSKLVAKKVSGKMIIEGEGISSAQTQSFTTFPALFSYNKLNFYDCPGFKDTRDTAHDITATYFIKKVLDHAKRVKLVLVSDHSLIMGADRTNFVELLKHTSLLVKDCSKFSGSTFLVATRVSEIEFDSDTGMGFVKPVESVVNDMGENLIKIKGELKEPNRNFTANDEARLNALKLLDSLVLKKEGKLNQLLVFRTPMVEKSLSQIKLMVDERDRIIKLLTDAPLVDISPSDFGYYLSNETQSDVTRIAAKIKTLIDEEVYNIGSDISLHIKHQKDILFSNSDLKLNEKLRSETHILDKLVDNFSAMDFDKMKELVKEQELSNWDEMNKSLENVDSVLKQINHLRFLQNYTSDDLESVAVECMNKLIKCFAGFRNSITWLSFLLDIYQELSSYAIQNQRKKYNVKDMKLWGKGGEGPIFITANNVDLFIQKLKLMVSKDYQLPEPSLIRNEKLDELNELLDLTLRQEVNSKPEDGALIVKQNLIILEEVRQVLEKLNDPKLNLKLFATDRIFVDCSLDRPGVNITMISPNIEILGERVISLKGAAWSVEKTPPNGVKGSDGKSGNNGGKFLVLTKSPLKGLTVDVSGGNGQDGQNGGDGASGEDGVDAPFEYNDAYVPEGKEGTDWEVVEKGNKKSEYKVFAKKKGYKGGDGGKGGNGGRGGNCGIVFTTTNSMKKVEAPGEGGCAGSFGKAGIGGKHGRDRKFFRLLYGGGGIFLPILTCEDGGLIDRSPERAESGVDGTKGESGAKGDAAVDSNFGAGVVVELAHDVSDYKLYGLEKEQSLFLGVSITSFLNQVLFTDKVDPIYEYISLFEETAKFEQSYFRLKEKPNLVNLYRDLLKRIARYSIKTEKLDDKIRNSLQVLYSAVLGKVCSLERGLQSTLIIDIRRYIRETISQIKIFKEKKFNSILREEKLKFGEVIKDRIKEAKGLINSQLAKGIDGLMEKTRAEIKSLLKEVESLENDLTKQRKSLDKLERQLELSAMLGIMKNMMGMLDLAGPYGEAANLVFKNAINIGESFNKIDKSPLNIDDLPNSVDVLNKLTEDAKKSTNNRADRLEKLIEDMVDKIDHRKKVTLYMTNVVTQGNQQKNPFTDLKSKLSELKDKIKAARVRVNQKNPEGKSNGDLSAAETTLNEVEDGIKEAVQNGGESSGKTKESSDSEKKKQEDDEKEKKEEDEMMDELKKLAKIGGGALKDTISGVMDSMKEIDTVNKASDKIFKQLVELDKYGRQVREVLTPMLEGMGDDLRRVEKELGDKSQVMLDIARWKVQSQMRDMKRLLEKLTDGFKAKEELSSLVMELAEAMNTMIGVYDRIEGYKHQAELADHIANMNDRSIGIERAEGGLGDLVLGMQLAVQTNIVLDRYEACCQAVKQWVFPFATNFDGQFELAEEVTKKKDVKNLTNKDVDTLIESALQNIEKLSTKVGDYYSSMQPQHKIIREYTNSSTFITWNNSKYHDSIEKLLSGDEVLLFADPALGSPFQAAVKFNKIKLEFKIGDRKIQDDLYSELKFFNLHLTHMGNSYYRFKNVIYSIESNEIPIVYSISGEGEQPVDPNDVMSMLKDGNILLSPYAMWKIKLTKIPSASQADFEKIKSFAGRVNLELTGYGKYLDESIDENLSDLKLDHFYTVSKVLFSN